MVQLSSIVILLLALVSIVAPTFAQQASSIIREASALNDKLISVASVVPGSWTVFEIIVVVFMIILILVVLAIAIMTLWSMKTKKR